MECEKKSHMQLSWNHKSKHFHTLRMAESKDGKSLYPQPPYHMLDTNITSFLVKLICF